METGLNYLNARYYNAAIGRFTSQDSMFWSFDDVWLADPQNQNSYGYARNNPITFSDPSGHCGPFTPLCIALGAYAVTYGGQYLNYASAALQTAYTGTLGYLAVKGYVNKDQQAINQAGALISLNIGIPSAPSQSAEIVQVERGAQYNFSQATVNPRMGNGLTIDDVAQGIRSGTINPSSLQVGVADIQGSKVITNNRTAAALTKAGVPQSEWNTAPVAAGSVSKVLTRLQNNNLNSAGSPQVVVTTRPQDYGVKGITVVDKPSSSSSTIKVKR